MLSFEDYYQEQLSKTSPIHRPSFDYDFSLNYAIQSPISAPISSLEARTTNERVADVKDNISYEDILASYEKIVQGENKKSAIPIQKKIKKKTYTFKPFASFESTEITVHQLQSVFNKISNQKCP